MPFKSVRLEPVGLIRAALATSLCLSAVLYFVWSWHWPLVGDASLIHYIGLLIERGWAPYRDFGDMNMPGSFLIELAAMHVFGMGDLAWRMFDFTLLLIAAFSFLVIARRSLWFPALFAASLFILIHGRDGLAEGGQRDLTMAVLLVAATAFLFLAVRRQAVWPAIVFGLLSGVAATIKPTALPLTLVQLALAAYAGRGRDVGDTDSILAGGGEARRISPLRLVGSASVASLAGPALALVFLLREHALDAFLAGFHGILPYYASLGHRSQGFVLQHSVSPVLPLVLLWLAVLALQWSQLHWRLTSQGGRQEAEADGVPQRPGSDYRGNLHGFAEGLPLIKVNPFQDAVPPAQDWERKALLAGVLFGLINCMVQARGLPYYRYPLLAFLLPVMALDLTGSMRRQWIPGLRPLAMRLLAVTALAFASFVLAPQSAVLLHRYRWWETDFIASLEQNLEVLGGQRLSGHIQCVDSISGCNNVLYRMRLEPATGVLSDFLLFGPAPGAPAVPIVTRTREQFAGAILAHPPEVIVVTSHLHIDGPDDYGKLARWPEFARFLAERYTLATQWAPSRSARWWSREETPAGYRIYILRNTVGGTTR